MVTKTGTKITKIADKLEKVSDSFTIYRYDNGYCLEISGRDTSEDWATAKIVCTNIEDLILLVKEAVTIQLD